MSKFDLTNTSFIIHYRKDSLDRAFNLRTICRFFLEKIDYGQLIIINDNNKVDDEMEQFKNNVNNIVPLFFQNDDHFKKSASFNAASNYATGELLCFYDVDVLIEPRFLKEAQDKILRGEYDHIYPFNGTFFNVKQEYFPRFLNTFNFELLLLSKELEYLEFASDTSPGGCNIISKEAFKKIGGYDESFIGWGFEDTDFKERSCRQNKIHYLSDKDAICWHLNHDNSIRLENPHYQRNLQIFIKNNR